MPVLLNSHPDPHKLADGSAAAPAYSFASAPTYGDYISGTATYKAIAGVAKHKYYADGMSLLSEDALLKFGPLEDLIIERISATTLRMRADSLSAVLEVVQNYTNEANNETLRFLFSSNIAYIQSNKNGGGTLRVMRIGPAGAGGLQLNTGATGPVEPYSSGGTSLGQDGNRFLEVHGTSVYAYTTVREGSTVAASGFIRMKKNSAGIHTLNQADGDVPLLVLDASDIVQIASTGVAYVRIDGGTSGKTVFESPLEIGTTPASVGHVRLPNAVDIVARNAGNTADAYLIGLTSSDVIEIGDAVSGTEQKVSIRSVLGWTRINAFIESPQYASGADPAAPAASDGRLYFRDNGAGKGQLCARFPTGAVQVVATEP